MEQKVFFVYFDKTDDGRIFYVGKGQKNRIGLKERNIYWKNIRKKYGWHREIVFATLDEHYSFELETGWIKEHKTFEPIWADGSGWGANLTAGGEGSSGRTGKFSARYGAILSEKSKKKMSQSQTGKIIPKEVRDKISRSTSGIKNKSAKLSEANIIEIISMLNRGISGVKIAKLFNISTAGLSRIRRGKSYTEYSSNINLKQNKRAKLTPEKADEIRDLYNIDFFTQEELATEYGVTRTCISQIVSGKTWKNI